MTLSPARFQFTDDDGTKVDFTLSRPPRPWRSGSRGIGGREFSAARVPSSYEIRRDRTLRLPLRVTEAEWPMLLKTLEHGGRDTVITITTGGVSRTCYLLEPQLSMDGGGIEASHSEFPGDMEIETLWVDTVDTGWAAIPSRSSVALLAVRGGQILTPDFFHSRADATPIATYVDRYGVIQRVSAPGDLRNAHYIDRVRHTLLELTRTNSLLWSEAFSNAAWASVGGPLVTSDDAVAPDGTATADKILDDSATAHEYKEQAVTVPNDSATRKASVHVKKRSGAPIACVGLAYKGGTAVYSNLHLDPETGAVAVESGSATPADYGVEDVGDYWRPWISLANNTSGNTTCTVVAIPARTGTLGASPAASATGYNHFWGAMLSAGEFPTSYIKTEAGAVTRAVDIASLSLPAAIADPRTPWARYTRWIAGMEGGGGLSAAPHIWQIGSGAGDFRLLLAWIGTSTLRLAHDAGASSDSASVTGLSVVRGDEVEAAVRWNGDGTATLIVAVNGIVVGSADLAGITPASAWNGSAVTYLNGRDGGNNAGAMALRDDLFFSGDLSGRSADSLMAEARSEAKVHG